MKWKAVKSTMKRSIWLILLLVTGSVAYAASGWSAPTTIDAEYGAYPSMTIVSGNPAISYYYYTGSFAKGLRYVRATDASGTTWGTPVDVAVSGNPFVSFPDVRVVSGNPAIAYSDDSAQELRYVRATDSMGTAWGSPISILDLGSQGGYLSMEVVNGRPAISYYQDSGGVWYVRANDALGTSWGTPIEIDSSGYIATTDLSVVNNNPAIAYRNVSGQMAYMRANDADGSSWPTTSTIINVGPNHGNYVSLAIVNGFPAVSYYGGTSNLTYTRATDVNGSAWGTHHVLDFNAGLGTSLLDVGGKPAIAYYDSGAVYYILAADANGDSWTPTQVIGDSSGSNYEPPLLMINNRPAVAYFDNVTDDLMYVRALTPTAVTLQSTAVTSILTDSLPVLLIFSLAIIGVIVAIIYTALGGKTSCE